MKKIYMTQTLELLHKTNKEFLDAIIPFLEKKECKSGLVYFILHENETVEK